MTADVLAIFMRERERKRSSCNSVDSSFFRKMKERGRERKRRKKKPDFFLLFLFCFLGCFPSFFFHLHKKKRKRNTKFLERLVFVNTVLVGQGGLCVLFGKKRGPRGGAKVKAKSWGCFLKSCGFLFCLSLLFSPPLPLSPLSSLSLSFSLSLSAARARKRGAWRTEKILRIILDEQ